MKKYVPAIITGFIMSVAGFVVGFEMSENDSIHAIQQPLGPPDEINKTAFLNDSVSYAQLITAVQIKETDSIADLVVIKGEFKKRVQGYFFNKNQTSRLKGSILNKSLSLQIKNIKGHIEYYNEKDSLIQRDSIRINDSIPPLTEKPFELKIKTPETFHSFNLYTDTAETSPVRL